MPTQSGCGGHSHTAEIHGSGVDVCHLHGDPGCGSVNTTSYWYWGGGRGKGWHRTLTNDSRCTPQPTTVSTTCLTTSKYCVTRGVYDAVLDAAANAITTPTGALCTSAQLTANGISQITQYRLASMMLAIPPWEINGGIMNIALSPMTLSRGDNMVNRRGDSNNIELYSHMTLDGYKRAHWNPGVGLWQLDEFKLPDLHVDALRYGHAERAHVDTGGFEVAKYIRYQYCNDMPLFGPWYGCKPDSCQITHNARYSSVTGSFQVEIVEGLTDPTGGTQDRLCRWGTAGMKMVCYVYDLSSAEGAVPETCCIFGTSYSSSYRRGYNPFTPEAAPFISFTDIDTYREMSTKFAVWPKVWPSIGLVWPTTTAAGSGEAAKTIIRAVRLNENARFSPYNDDSDTYPKGIAYHGLIIIREDDENETAAAYEARIEAKIKQLNGGPLTVNNSAVNFGLNAGGPGPEGWFDSLVNGRDLQIYNCPDAIGDTLVESCWVSTNGASSGD